MKLQFLSLLLLCSFIQVSFAQSYKWKLEKEYKSSKIEAWDINPLHELIVFEKGVFYKFNKDFKQEFTQSSKGFNGVTKIDASHSLKTLVFSKDYQRIAFLDNTLSFQMPKLELDELQVGYANNVCYSNETNRFWVFDEQNTRLLRFGGQKSKDLQSETSNLMSITQNNLPTEMIESKNELLLFYEKSDLFIFDYYGSLIQRFEYAEAIHFYPTEKHIYVLNPEEIIRVDRIVYSEEVLPIPFKGVESLKVVGNSVYLKDDTGIRKYSLIPAP